MKDRIDNIFFNLIKNETSLTEALCNLMSLKSFRNHFLNFIKIENFNISIEDVKFNNFLTEKDFGKDFALNESNEDKKIGRGDLILELNNNEFIFELKIEISTGLTKNQPDGYLKYLRQNNFSQNNLFFIIPKDYKDSKLELINDSNILYWEDFIDSLKRNGLTDIDYINDFCKILDSRWFYFESIEFNSYESNLINGTEELKMENKNIPSIMMSLFEKVNIIQDKFTNKSQNNQYKDSIQYGFFLKNKDKKDILWFGIDYEFWKLSGVPFSIGIDKLDEQYFNKFSDKYTKDIIKIEYGNNTSFYHLPIKIDNNMDTNKIVKLIKQVKQDIDL